MKQKKEFIRVNQSELIENEIIQDLVGTDELENDTQAILESMNPEGVLNNPLKEEETIAELLKK